MEPKYYIEDYSHWDTEYVFDFIKFDEEGRIDYVREENGNFYLLEKDIKLPKLETEYEYIMYLTGKYIHEKLAKKLEQLIGFKLEQIEIDYEAVDNVLAFNHPLGREIEPGTGIYKSTKGTDLKADMPCEVALQDVIIQVMKVIRTLLHNKGEQHIEPIIRIK